MKICGAQTKPVKGDISANIENHKKLIDRAVANRTDIVISPELSLTGYEPELAHQRNLTHPHASVRSSFSRTKRGKHILRDTCIPMKRNSLFAEQMIIV